MITVAIPYWGVPHLVQRAVESVLAQDVPDFRLIVMGDGQDPPLDPAIRRDPRLTVYVLPENRGPYFAQQVVLTATPDEHYAVVGADDWVEPDHLSRLRDLMTDDGAVIPGAVWFHARSGKASVHEGSYEVGLFRVSRLLELGGHNPGERMGQDTLMIRLLKLTGSPAASPHPTYHRVKREGSLMTSPKTGLGSPARNAMRARNRRVFHACVALKSRGAIAKYRAGLVPPNLVREVMIHAAELRDILKEKT